MRSAITELTERGCLSAAGMHLKQPSRAETRIRTRLAFRIGANLTRESSQEEREIVEIK